MTIVFFFSVSVVFNKKLLMIMTNIEVCKVGRDIYCSLISQLICVVLLNRQQASRLEVRWDTNVG